MVATAHASTHSIYVNATDADASDAAYDCHAVRSDGQMPPMLERRLLGAVVPDGYVLTAASLGVRGCWIGSAPDSGHRCLVRLTLNSQDVLSGVGALCGDMFPECSRGSAMAVVAGDLDGDSWGYPSLALNELSLQFDYYVENRKRPTLCTWNASVTLEAVVMSLAEETWPPGLVWPGGRPAAPDEPSVCDQSSPALSESHLFASSLLAFPAYGADYWAQCVASLVVVVVPAASVVRVASSPLFVEFPARVSDDGKMLVCQGVPVLPGADEIEAVAAAAGVQGTARGLVLDGAVRFVWTARIGRSRRSAVAVAGWAATQLYEPPATQQSGTTSLVLYGAAGLFYSPNLRTATVPWNATSWSERLRLFPLEPLAFLVSSYADGASSTCQEFYPVLAGGDGRSDAAPVCGCRFAVGAAQVGVSSSLCVSVDGGARYFDAGTPVKVVRSGFVDALPWSVSLALCALPLIAYWSLQAPSERAIVVGGGAYQRLAAPPPPPPPRGSWQRRLERCWTVMRAPQPAPWPGREDPYVSRVACVGLLFAVSLCLPAIVLAFGSRYPSVAFLLCGGCVVGVPSCVDCNRSSRTVAGVLANGCCSLLLLCLVAVTQLWPRLPGASSLVALVAALCGIGWSLAATCAMLRGWSRCSACSTCGRLFPPHTELAYWRAGAYRRCCERQQHTDPVAGASRLPQDVAMLVAVYVVDAPVSSSAPLAGCE